MTKFTINFDGSCEPKNPDGIATFGYVIKDEKGNIVEQKAEVIGEGSGMTNNIAEYTGLLQALKGIKKLIVDGDKITIMGDSQLVIRQLSGQYQARSANIIPLFNEVKEKLKDIHFRGVKTDLEWIPREQNTCADDLTHKVFMEYCTLKGYDYIPCECGGTLVLRTNKKNGSQFYGCSRFPKCKNTKSVKEEK